MDVALARSRDGDWLNFTQSQAIRGVGRLNVDVALSESAVIGSASLNGLDEISIVNSDFFARREPQEFLERSDIENEIHEFVILYQ